MDPATVTAGRRAALIDRDGTINVEIGYLDDPDDLELIPGAAPALRRLRELGLAIVVVTNQAQVGRGKLAPERLQAIHDRLLSMLSDEGVEIDIVLHCPHAPEQGCECRKPAAGMAIEAQRRLGIDLTSSFVVGDHAGDVLMGRAIGATGILVLTGHGEHELARARGVVDHVAADLTAAADIIAALVHEEADVNADPIDAVARRYLGEAADTLRAVEADCLPDIATAARLMIDALRAGGKLLICGNGGSAADAQHLATEFVSTLTVDHPRPSIPAIAITTDTSLLTAIANDFGVEGIFSRQIESIGRSGDVLVAISTSGNSANVVAAGEAAGERDLRVIALTGADGGDLAARADVAIRVPSSVTAHIQEAHLAIEQLLALIVESALYPRD